MKRNKLKLALVILGIIVCAVIITFAIAWFMVPLDISKIDNLAQASAIEDRDGNRLAEVAGSERRINISIKDVPDDVKNAFIAAEDARFYSHFGIDPWRMGGALVANLKHLSYAEGASTITQQLIKLTHLTSDKTMTRKLKELLLALKLERVMTKDEILESYLNTVYFGAGAYGIQSASQIYFGKDASALSLEQGALLAAIIKSPSRYAPHINQDNALKRRNLVLGEMLQYGFITESAEAAAKDAPIAINKISASTTDYPWVVDYATSEAANALGISLDELLQGGYVIKTSLDQSMQQTANKLFENSANFPKDAPDGAKVEAALVALDPRSGEILTMVGGREYTVQRGLNRASGMSRQPGSAFKPISVYAAAIDQYSYLPVSMISDEQRDFGGGYSPRNVGGTYNGTVTLRESLSRSLNAASVDLIIKTSIQSARQYAEKAGIALTDSDNNLSLALGSLTDGTSPLALTSAYAPLANGGKTVTSHIVTEITDAYGKVLYRAQPSSSQVMKPESAYMLTSMLRSAVSMGSAQKLSSLGFDVAAKTGTVAMDGSGNRDIWTVCYSPTVALGVWMGFDQPSSTRTMPDTASGSNQPAALCAAFMSASKDKAGTARFTMPDTLQEVLIDARALEQSYRPMLATNYTPKELTLREVFYKGKTPTEHSNAWIAPMRVFDLSGEMITRASATLRFTCLETSAIYRLYRLDYGVPVQVAELSGESGQRFMFTDEYSYEGAEYYVIPFSAELLEYGISLEGRASDSIILDKPFGFRDWIALPTPEPTAEPIGVPDVEPLMVG